MRAAYRSGSLGSGVFRSGALGADAATTVVSADPAVCAPITACLNSAGIYIPANTAIDQDLKAPLNQLFAVSIVGLAAAVVYLSVKK